MSFRLVKAAFAVEKLPPVPKLIYLILCWKADEHRTAQAGLAWLSRRVGLAEKNVRVYLRGLEASNWIRLQSRGNGRGRLSVYYICPIPERVTLQVPFTHQVLARKGNETGQIKGNASVPPVLNKRYRQEQPPSAAASPRTQESRSIPSLFVERIHAYANP